MKLLNAARDDDREAAEAACAEVLSFLRLPRQHHQQMRLTNVLERLNQEIKRRTAVVRGCQ